MNPFDDDDKECYETCRPPHIPGKVFFYTITAIVVLVTIVAFIFN